ncbi:MAG: tRNA-dihydrouridine synthase family protein [Thermodesulfobacteriota bacterium]|nr:tRNA-dihydrouridine synthase family protein [Thermodesulfobacteriota bacterium]
MKKRLILAPLQGFTDAVFRNVYTRHFSGLDEAMAPFISTMGQKRLKPSRIKDIHPENNKNLAVIPQILGNAAEDFIFLTRHIADLGHKTVNWNLGCPHSKITKKKRGSGLLPFPEEIDSFLEKVITEVPCTLSVKVRLGKKSDKEIFDLLPIFNKYPLKEIIVHPRTGIQMYEGKADANAFTEISNKTDHTLVYNGDITGKQRVEQIQRLCPGVNRFMIGRGILANPFLPEEIKGEKINKNESHERIKAFHDDLFKTYDKIFSGPSHITGRMKGFWSYLGPSFKDSHKALKKILKTKNREQYLRASEHFFALKLPFSPPE